MEAHDLVFFRFHVFQIRKTGAHGSRFPPPPQRKLTADRVWSNVITMRGGNFLRRLVLIAAAALLASCGLHRNQPAPTIEYTTRTPDQLRANPNDVLFRAIGLVGTPYRHGGNTPAGGFDCSGLVGYVFRDVAGIVLPRTSEDISRVSAPDIARDRLESGDLVFFHGSRQVSHVGIYVGKGRFVHAPNTGGTVRLDELDAPYWQEHYSGAKRIVH
jgi:cell wall-associated NlpC family hydrolase